MVSPHGHLRPIPHAIGISASRIRLCARRAPFEKHGRHGRRARHARRRQHCRRPSGLERRVGTLRKASARPAHASLSGLSDSLSHFARTHAAGSRTSLQIKSRPQ